MIFCNLALCGAASACIITAEVCVGDAKGQLHSLQHTKLVVVSCFSPLFSTPTLLLIATTKVLHTEAWNLAWVTFGVVTFCFFEGWPKKVKVKVKVTGVKLKKNAKKWSKHPKNAKWRVCKNYGVCCYYSLCCYYSPCFSTNVSYSY